jgi:hypothetical protein
MLYFRLESKVMNNWLSVLESERLETEHLKFEADEMSQEIEACVCLHRIRTLQNLCGSDAHPAALLIIPGIDGRNNANSMSLLKYIFGNSVGMELFDSSVIDNSLDEMVLLIQRDSISAIYSSIAKEICGSVLSCCNLIEYLPLVDEENEVLSYSIEKYTDAVTTSQEQRLFNFYLKPKRVNLSCA